MRASHQGGGKESENVWVWTTRADVGGRGQLGVVVMASEPSKATARTCHRGEFETSPIGLVFDEAQFGEVGQGP